MRRGFLRLRSSSAPRRGFIHLGYLREVLFVALLIGGVITAQQAFRAPAATTAENAHADHPVYGLSVADSGETLWIARERYGVSQIDLMDGSERDRWKLLQTEASFAAHSGESPALTIRYGIDRRVEFLRGNVAIHSEVLPMEMALTTDTDVSRDGRVAILVSNDGKMKIWKIEESEILQERIDLIPAQADHAAISPDGKLVAIVNWEGVTLCSLDEPRVVAFWKVAHGGAPTIRANRADTLAWSPDSKRLALGLDDGLVRVWNIADQELVWEHRADHFKLTAVAFSKCGTRLATGGFDKHIRVWDLNEKHIVWVQKGHTRSIHNLVFAAGDTRLYSGGLDGRVYEWELSSGQLLRELQ